MSGNNQTGQGLENMRDGAKPPNPVLEAFHGLAWSCEGGRYCAAKLLLWQESAAFAPEN